MAGTLTISTLSDGTNSTSATNCIQGSAKAWVNFDGVTTATIRASYNVSSVTRNSTGNYTVNFTNAMVDTNYSVNANGNEFPASGFCYSLNVDSLSTTAVTLEAYRTDSSSSAIVDYGFCSVAVFR